MRLYLDKKEAQALKDSLELLIRGNAEDKEILQIILDRLLMCLELQGKKPPRR